MRLKRYRVLKNWPLCIPVRKGGILVVNSKNQAIITYGLMDTRMYGKYRYWSFAANPELFKLMKNSKRKKK